MRDLVVWITAAALLVAALHTVSVRTQVYALARQNGALADRLLSLRRHNDNLGIELEKARSPQALLELASAAGIVIARAGDEPETEARP